MVGCVVCTSRGLLLPLRALVVCSEQRSDKGLVVVIRCDPMELMYPGSLWLGQVTVDEDNLLRVWWRHQG